MQPQQTQASPTPDRGPAEAAVQPAAELSELKLPKLSPTSVSVLVQQLGSNEYASRERAVYELSRNRSALPELARAAATAPDFEVRQQAERLVLKYFTERSAFLK